MAITGGKVRLLHPVDFASQIVSIGDATTSSDVPRSIVIGSGASTTKPFPAAALSSNIVIGPSASSNNGDAVIVLGDNTRIVSNTTPEARVAYQCIVIGAGTTVTTDDNSSDGWLVTVGPDIQVTGYSSESVLLGDHASATDSHMSTIIGINATCTLAGRSVVIGDEAHSDFQVAPNISYCVVIGTRAYSGPATDFAVVIGYEAQCIDNRFSTVIGYQARITGSNNALAMGSQALIESNAPSSVAIGPFASIASGNAYAVVMGSHASISGVNSSSSIVIGPYADCLDNCESSVMVGARSLIEINSPRSVLLGFDCIATNDCADAVVIGNAAKASNGTSVPPSVVIGYFAMANGGVIVVGDSSQAGNMPGDVVATGVVLGPAEVSTGEIANRTIMAGHGSIATNCYDTVILGSQSVGGDVGKTLPYSLITGYGNIVIDATAGMLNYHHVVVGAGNTIGDETEDSSVFGQSNVVSSNFGSTIIGRGNIVTPGSLGQYNLIFGNNNTISDGDYSLLIGESLTVSASESITLGFGASNSTNNTMIVGSDFSPIHKLVINGYNGGDLLTLAVSDSPPSDGQTGLTVTFNTGAGVVNREVFISNTPPPNAIILYMNP
jgi:hypothetical protein